MVVVIVAAMVAIIAAATGAGIADDKAVYSFVPDIIKFYTGEKPKLENIKTWRCSEKNDLVYVIIVLAVKAKKQELSCGQILEEAQLGDKSVREK